MPTSYDGTQYWDYPTIEAWCIKFCEDHRDWATLETIGYSREGRPILLVTLGGDPTAVPTFWLDGGTHAMEWTGVMATLYALSEWAKEFDTEDGQEWFKNNAICVLPCISPDGYQWVHEGKPLLRSSTRPPLPGTQMTGFTPQDINGDGTVSYMRWMHPAGPFVRDSSSEMGVRFRQIHDNPAQACFLSREGLFVNWDGKRWIQAPRTHGVDLNRNFPVHWNPFSMGGMDGGIHALSEPEAKTLMDAVVGRPGIVSALTNHTYTGALLVQPYRKDSPLKSTDLKLMSRLANEAVRGTAYKVMKVHPEFTYDDSNPIVGVWADCLSSTLGIPGYTLELWNPFGFAGIDNASPAQFFRNPDPEMVSKVMNAAAKEAPIPWTKYEHPQLGPVEIGGFDYLRTIRNPPERLLQQECQDGFVVAQALRFSLPKLKVTPTSNHIGEELFEVEVMIENLGYLSTIGLDRAQQLSLTSGITLQIDLTVPDQSLISGEATTDLGVLDGWGNMQVSGAISSVYPKMSSRGHRNLARWIIKGRGKVTISWHSHRAGQGQLDIKL
ncbi:MAG: M14 family zinc carboxypeptidase [Myxococcota bacterium]|nr:M14 family zinc carboxypeptidase [Myxococcota bacterium]